MTLFVFFYNKNTIKKIDDLNSLEKIIFQNGNLIEKCRFS